MRGWLVDTDVIADLCSAKPDAKVRKWIGAQPESRLWLSIVTLAEYRKTIARMEFGHARRPALERAVDALERRFAGRVLSLTDAVVLRWGAMSGAASQMKGYSPGMLITLQAATAMENNLYLATGEVESVNHTGVHGFNPWKDDPRLFAVDLT
ncbi:MAG TPA: PIN domain-containing protein [Terracidiphilus sp.]|nr:PIN domain-containing protein [Terracidiphilus sp.]